MRRIRRMILPLGQPRVARRSTRTTAPTILTLQPSPGCSVRDPTTLLLLDAAGDQVVLNDFYRRRLLCGDVVDITGDSSVVGGLSPAEHHRRHGRGQET
jgi:hypothetical protein